ncbi:Sodium/myo-inositol cotransporter [Fasciolopsis buskii]|uniref:Sodium/myo-inositol cotransporter n=1 Tax=Fasciolopsis buskii TaxID=27845 RepID=A0A8E0RVL3_9TREM|nr:Sodium/myo-inositol cotransporter [Fasciolopsis buski]
MGAHKNLPCYNALRQHDVRSTQCQPKSGLSSLRPVHELAMSGVRIDSFDIAVLILYFIGVLVAGFAVGASLFASNIGSEHFIGLSGSGAASGFGVGAFELNATILLQLLGWVFLPVYISSGVSLSAMKNTTSILAFVRVGGFGGLINSYGSSIAYVNASTMQGSELLVNLVNAYHQTNGTELLELASHSNDLARLKCGLPSPKAFRLLREINDPDMPWLGFLLGQTPASIWYWCADQMMVQRALAAKSLSHAQGATLMAGAIKILPFFIMVIPGMISRVLFPGRHHLKHVVQNRSIHSVCIFENFISQLSIHLTRTERTVAPFVPLLMYECK